MSVVNDLIISDLDLNILGSFLLHDSPKNKYDMYDEDSCCYHYHDYIDMIENSDEEYNNRHNDYNCYDDHNHNDHNKQAKDQRDLGFVMLSNPEKVSSHLKKTKFCQVLIDRGQCNRTVCNFAHSVSEIVFPECAFRDDCRKKRSCKFKHPCESNEEYKIRIQFCVPNNIIKYYFKHCSHFIITL